MRCSVVGPFRQDLGETQRRLRIARGSGALQPSSCLGQITLGAARLREEQAQPAGGYAVALRRRDLVELGRLARILLVTDRDDELGSWTKPICRTASMSPLSERR